MTIKELRKALKESGFKVSIKTYSHGPHATFTDIKTGKKSTSITFSRGDELSDILQAFQGLEIDGQKVYGIESATLKVTAI